MKRTMIWLLMLFSVGGLAFSSAVCFVLLTIKKSHSSASQRFAALLMRSDFHVSVYVPLASMDTFCSVFQVYVMIIWVVRLSIHFLLMISVSVCIFLPFFSFHNSYRYKTFSNTSINQIYRKMQNQSETKYDSH